MTCAARHTSRLADTWSPTSSTAPSSCAPSARLLTFCPVLSTLTCSSRDITPVWLVATLVARLQPNVHGKVLRAAGELLERTRLSALHDDEAAGAQQGVLGHEPFLGSCAAVLSLFAKLTLPCLQA